MRDVKVRTAFTSTGLCALSPWSEDELKFSVSMLNLGNNFISSLEIVSSLNCFNLAYCMYHYNSNNCPKNYNPKVYLGTVQTASTNWNYDNNLGRKTGLEILPDGAEKSGS